ncbi:MAG: pyridoxamine 5'-phosphate oxidase family protein, partial [Candidatus Dormibacterales bacterium]
MTEHLLEGDGGILARARIGMLALNAGASPLVNPVAFHHAAGSVWMTTSRSAVKVALLKRDPRAGFLVWSRARHLLVQGRLEHFDPRSLSGQLRAVLSGPAFYLGLAGYALKNAAYIGGYALDAARMPVQWWPHNRVVIRLRPARALWMDMDPPPEPGPAGIPAAPIPVRRSLVGERSAYLCWRDEGVPSLVPVLWASRGADLVVAQAAGAAAPPAPLPAALVIESHRHLRATRMRGVCLRGLLTPDEEAREEVADRYQMEAEGLGAGFALGVRR